MANHTQGPWKVDNLSSITDSDGFVIASRVWGDTQENSDANARLIAASPDLLVAIKYLLAEYRLETMSGSDIDGPDQREEVIMARAAIAKAEGK